VTTRDALSTVFSDAVLSALNPASLSHKYIDRLFNDTDAWSAPQREVLSEALTSARRHRAFNTNLIQRLRSPDEFLFFGQLYELKVARHFELHGAQLRFSPPGRGRSALEFSARLSLPESGAHVTMLVEVKTPQRSKQELQVRQSGDALAQLAEGVVGRGRVVVTVTKSGMFRVSRFRAFLSSQIDALQCRAERGEAFPMATFADAAGLTADVTLVGRASNGDQLEVSVLRGPKPVRNEDALRSTVLSAAGQLPRVRSRPAIVVVCPQFEFPAGPQEFIRALYGTTVFTVKTSTVGSRASREFAPTGLFAQGRHRRVSAVLWLDECGSRYNVDFRLVAFHHPDPFVPIPPDVLRPFVSRQLVVRAGDLVWDDGASADIE
jgi:hypothetical protein